MLLLPELTLQRLLVLNAIFGIVIFQYTWRNTRDYRATPVLAVLFALAEAVAQAVILVGTFMLLQTIWLLLFPSASPLNWITLLLTAAIALVPTKRVTAYLTERLKQQQR